MICKSKRKERLNYLRRIRMWRDQILKTADVRKLPEQIVELKEVASFQMLCGFGTEIIVYLQNGVLVRVMYRDYYYQDGKRLVMRLYFELIKMEGKNE